MSAHLLFDLDGTLIDSLPAISVSVDRTMDDLDVPRPTPERVRAMVGAPLRRVFAHLLGADRESLVEPAIVRYRVHFEDVGRTRIQLYPGIGDALDFFRGWGHQMQLVTARSAPSAVGLLQQFDIGHYFDHVHAPETAQTPYDKADHVHAALQRAGVSAASALFIGDRADDMRAASAHGVPAVGVLWGNGSREELEASGAAAVVADSSELVARVRGWQIDGVASARG